MGRKELFALKLQMGIDPALQIEPDVLRAMWRQLTLESANAQSKRSRAAPQPVPVTTNLMVI